MLQTLHLLLPFSTLLDQGHYNLRLLLLEAVHGFLQPRAQFSVLRGQFLDLLFGVFLEHFVILFQDRILLDDLLCIYPLFHHVHVPLHNEELVFQLLYFGSHSGVVGPELRQLLLLEPRFKGLHPDLLLKVCE